MLTFFVLAFFALIAAVIINGNYDRARSARTAELRANREALDREFGANCREVRNELLSGIPMVDDVQIVGCDRGFIAMDEAGTTLRLVKVKRTGVDAIATADETIAAKDIVSVEIDQPTRPTTVTHIESVPVAVGSGRSSIGRGVVGGLVAGPTGALVGGMSGLGGSSQIEHVQVKRHETVYSKGHPKLVIQIDQLMEPRRVLEFKTVAETNLWSSRIFNAINRAKRLGS